MSDRAVRILLFDLQRKDERAGENQTRRTKKDIIINIIDYKYTTKTK